jgi:ATP-dependent Clp protease ATP-binding subunit ClpX
MRCSKWSNDMKMEAIKKIYCHIDSNDILALSLYDLFKESLTSGINVTNDCNSEHKGITVFCENKDGSSSTPLYLEISEEIYRLPIHYRDLYLYLLLSKMLHYIGGDDLVVHSAEITYGTNIYFQTLCFAFGSAISTLKRINNSGQILTQTLKAGLPTSSQLARLPLNVTFKQMTIEISEDLYATLLFEIDEKELYTSMRIKPLNYSKIDIEFIRKERKSRINHIAITIDGYKVYRDVFFLDQIPAESLFHENNPVGKFPIKWFTKSTNTPTTLIQNGYLPLDYLTLILKAKQHLFQTAALINNKKQSNYALYLHQKEFINHKEDSKLFLQEHKQLMEQIAKDSTHVQSAAEILKEIKIPDMAISSKNSTHSIVAPSKMEKELDIYIVGQKHAKQTLSTIIHSHLNFHNNPDKYTQIFSNILISGATGTGKTYLMQTIAKLYDLPFVHVNAASLTPEGYRGKNLSHVVDDIVRASGYDKERAEAAIVFFDEIDKLTDDDYTKNVLDQLLRFSEGDELTVTLDYKEWEKIDFKTINTRTMLKVFAGSFSHYHDEKAKAGFLRNHDTKKENPHDVIMRAFRHESVGRFDKAIHLEKPSIEEICALLKENEHNEFKKTCAAVEGYGHTVEIDDSVYNHLAHAVYNSPLGMRRIKQIALQLFSPLLYIAPEIKPTTFVLYEHDILAAIKAAI